MNINKNSSGILKLSALTMFIMLSSCSLSNTTNTTTKNQLSIPIEIKFSQVNNAFQTKASANGVMPKITDDIKSYTIGLCTNPSQPITTKITGTPFVINRGTSDLVGGIHKVLFVDTPVGGSYYATVMAWDGLNGSGNNITRAMNYTTDGTIGLAVSSNFVSVDSNLALSFSDSPNNKLDVSLNLLDGLPAKIETKIINVQDGDRGSLALDEFIVNSYTTSDQENSSVAMSNSGNMVIAWESSGQDLGLEGIYAQRYDVFGNPIGNEFWVNSSSMGEQEKPAVAMDAMGNFVIVWQSNGQDGDGYGIYAQRYSNTGNPIGSEFKVNTETINDQANPSIVMYSTGGFIVTWDSLNQDGDGYGIYAQKFSDLGNPINTEFKVNTYTTNAQENPSIAINDSGNFIITWQSYNQDGDEYGIYAQRFDNTANPIGTEFKVNTYTSDIQTNPSIAMADNGNFVITWESKNQDGDKYGIYAQRFDGLADPLDSEFQINENTINSQNNSSISMDSGGNFIVTWENNNQDGTSYGISARKYFNSGMPTTNEIKINTIENNGEYSPKVANRDLGDFVITWSKVSGDNNGDGVIAKIFDRNNFVH